MRNPVGTGRGTNRTQRNLADPLIRSEDGLLVKAIWAKKAKRHGGPRKKSWKRIDIQGKLKSYTISKHANHG
jgi:hypothetical protein